MLSGIVVTFSASWFVENNDVIRYSGYIHCKLLKVGL